MVGCEAAGRADLVPVEEVMTEPEPNLELSEEEWAKVRLVRSFVCKNSDGSVTCGACRENHDLIDFLLRLEAGRQEALYWTTAVLDPRYYPEKKQRTPAGWLAAVTKERMGE